jgi:hypothetical protein
MLNKSEKKQKQSNNKKDINPIEAIAEGGLDLLDRNQETTSEKKIKKEDEESIKVTFTMPVSLFVEMEQHIYQEKKKRRKLFDKVRRKEKVINKSGYIAFAIEETLKGEGYYHTQ